jgi:predicted CXXCH cytochrome family protein
MPRTALRTAALWSLVAAAAFGATSPHVDPSVLRGGCAACHQGHGVSRSPMLGGPQKQICLSCHGTFNDAAAKAATGAISPAARPALIGAAAKLYEHPISAEAVTAEAGVVTCTSCHSPHRGAQENGDNGGGKRSPRNTAQFEYELCVSCHGGGTNGNRASIARKIDPNNRSYHPIAAPSSEPGTTVDPKSSGQRISCTDCHGNDDRQGPRGPHGSNIPALLRAQYRQTDGAESPQAFALCYGCHDRDKVLHAPLHARHVAERGAACRTCHDAHGSVSHRALVHIGENDGLQQVLPSLSAGRLAFGSEAPGSGECYLTCHGVDHGPKSYGIVAAASSAPFSAIPGLAPMQPVRGAGGSGRQRDPVAPRRERP